MSLSDLVPQIQRCDWKPDRFAMAPQKKLCPKCNENLPYANFAVKGNRRQSYCKNCSNANNKLAYRSK